MHKKIGDNMRSAIIAAVVAALVSAAGASAVKRAVIDGRDIRDHSISLSKLTRGARATLHGKRGPVGPQGPVGHEGPRGLTGEQGPSAGVGARMVSGDAREVLPHENGWASADCPTGMLAIGGGGELVPLGGWHGGVKLSTAWIIASSSNENDHSWIMQAYNSDDSPVDLIAHAICVPARYV